MKCSVFVSLIALTLISCSPNNGIDLDEPYPQKWQLMEMPGNIADVPPSTGSDMAWQEYYLLYSDSIFIKSREEKNVITEETGRFAFVTLSDGKYLELIYELNNDQIGNCTSEAKELLKLATENKLIGTWWACDGPGLVYERTK